MTERELMQALWLARAMRAQSEVEHWKRINRDFSGYRYGINHVLDVDEKRTPSDWIFIWTWVERKCRQKMKEYE